MKKTVIFVLLFGVCGLLFAQGSADGTGSNAVIEAPAVEIRGDKPAVKKPRPAAKAAAKVKPDTSAVVDMGQATAETVGNEAQVTTEPIGNEAQAPDDAAVNETQITTEPTGGEAQVTADITDNDAQITIEAIGNEEQISTEIADNPVIGEEGSPSPAAPVSVPVSDKPKIAVYVTGGKDVAENKALCTYILEALVRSERYIAIERTDAFLAEIDNEQVAQRSGAIDDAQISRLGKQSGVQFVCVADITQALRGAQVSARVLDVETAEVREVGTAESPLRTMEDLKRVSTDVVCVMLGITQKREKRVRFAGRLAYANSYVSKYSVEVYSYDPSTALLKPKELYNSMGAGSGFEVGVSTIIGIIDGLAVDVGTNFVWRKSVTIKDAYDVSEYALTVPALLRGRLFKSPAYIQGGVQLDIPFNTTMTEKGGKKSKLDDREPVDFGLIIGAGWQFRKDMQADIRAIHGLRSFDGQNDHLLYSVSVGVSYLY